MKTKELKKQEAIDRQELRNKLTPIQQLEKLDKMFGKGKGAKKERIKLQKIIETQSNFDKTKREEKKKRENKNFKVKKGENPIKAKKKYRKERKKNK